MIRLLSILMILCTLMGCKKSPTVLEEPVVDPLDMLELQWGTRMELDSEVAGINDPQHYGDMVIKSNGDNINTILYFFDKISGQMIEKLTLIGNESIGKPSESVVYNNLYIAEAGAKKFLCLNLDTREVEWMLDLGSSRGRLHRVGDRVFLVGYTIDSSPQILELDPQTGQYQMYYQNGMVAGFSRPAIYNGPLFDSEVAILNFYPQAGSTPPQLADQDIIAVDMSTQQEIWRTSKFSENFPCNYFLPPVIYEDVVITGGDWSIYGFDLQTGEQLWRTEIDTLNKQGVFIQTHHLLKDDRLYVNSLVDPLACLNPRTGEVIWRTDDAANCSRKMIYDEENDFLIMSCWGKGSLLIYDALTGELLHKERGYDDSIHTANNVIYDPETDLFFANTHKHMIGFKLITE